MGVAASLYQPSFDDLVEYGARRASEAGVVLYFPTRPGKLYIIPPMPSADVEGERRGRAQAYADGFGEVQGLGEGVQGEVRVA